MTRASAERQRKLAKECKQKERENKRKSEKQRRKRDKQSNVNGQQNKRPQSVNEKRQRKETVNISDEDKEMPDEDNEDQQDTWSNQGGSLKRNNVVYYTVKLYSKGGRDPLKLLQLNLQTWFRTMKSGANSIIVYDPKDTNPPSAITSHLDISSNLQQLRKYFIGVRPKTNTGDIWFQVKIGMNKLEGEFNANTSWWFQESQSGMFRKALQ